MSQNTGPQNSPDISLDISLEEFQAMTDRAGLGMTRQEVEELKPVYEIYLEYIRQVHSIEFGPEEMVVEFHPD